MDFDRQKDIISKEKRIIKLVSISILILEVVFFVSEEIVDLYYTNPAGESEERKEMNNKKLKFSLLRIGGNLVCFILILIFIITYYSLKIPLFNVISFYLNEYVI